MVHVTARSQIWVMEQCFPCHENEKRPQIFSFIGNQRVKFVISVLYFERLVLKEIMRTIQKKRRHISSPFNCRVDGSTVIERKRVQDIIHDDKTIETTLDYCQPKKTCVLSLFSCELDDESFWKEIFSKTDRKNLNAYINSWSEGGSEK